MLCQEPDGGGCPPGSTCLPLPILRPPICSVGCGEILGMSRRAAPAKVPPPVALGTPSRVSGDTRVVSTASWFPPPQGQAIGYDLDPSVILAVEVFEVEVDQAGVCCYPCPRFPAYAGCCPFHGPPPVLAKVQTAHKPRGGRQEGLERDGTGRSGQIRAVAIGGATREAGGTGGSGSCCHCGRGLW